MLVGEKVRLRALERTDIPRLVKWLNDPEVKRYLRMYWPMSQAEEEIWFERQLSNPNARIFAIEAEDGTHIGNISLDEIDWKNRKAIMGIIIGERDYWDQGYGSDAVKTLLSFAFHELNLNRIELSVYDFNPRAIRCYEKCGFVIEGRLRQSIFRNGRYHDELKMAILREEWRCQKG
ncbi:GNAT family N-acetyltransferase [Candidatus Poribacteria bacterium]|nr:GNAT family N-acetyltransferase [Candidatus Poribacteria bacterium]